MKAKWFTTILIVAMFVISFVPAASGASAASQVPDKIVVGKFGETSVTEASGTIGDNLLGPIYTEIQKPKRLGTNPLRSAPANGDAVYLNPGSGSPTSSGKHAKSNPQVNFSLEGLNHRDSRLAFGGNQFSGEPADQGLCAGNGYILETVNSALRVYDSGPVPSDSCSCP